MALGHRSSRRNTSIGLEFSERYLWCRTAYRRKVALLGAYLHAPKVSKADLHFSKLSFKRGIRRTVTKAVLTVQLPFDSPERYLELVGLRWKEAPAACFCGISFQS